MTYFQNVYEAMPASIDMVREKLKQWKQRYIFEVELVQTEDAVKTGFYIKCDNIRWHVRWNPVTSHVEAFENDRQIVGYNNVNNSAKTSSMRLVEDIHRAKLMSMPEDYSDVADWLKQLSRK